MIISARYSNPDNSAAVAVTDDLGAVLISQGGTPGQWDALQAWGTPEPYVAATDVPETISDRQFFQGLALKGKITQAEALAAVKTGTIPTILRNALAAMTGADAFNAEMLLSGATQFNRSHQLTNALGQALGYLPADLDDFWTFASGL